MKRFRFSLRPVAVIRAHQESRAKEAYRAAHAVLASAEQRLAVAQARVKSLADAIDAQRRGAFSALQAAATFRAYSLECQEVARDEKGVNDARERLRLARESYVKAHQDLRVVQRLEEKARAAHATACGLLEQGALDELAAAARGRALQVS